MKQKVSLGMVAGAGLALLYVLLTARPTNLLVNPGFEDRTYETIGGNVPVGWKNFFCDTPYTPAKCPAQKRDTRSPARSGYNDPSLLMGLPEWGDISKAAVGRVRSGTYAAKIFSFHRVHDGGLLQTINTVPGQTCLFEVYVQTWSSNSEMGTNGPYTSDLNRPDDLINSVWYLGTAPGTDTYAFSSTVTWSKPFMFADGHYDKYARLSLAFVPTTNKTTVYIRSTFVWPNKHNDGYMDDAYAGCANEEVTPTVTTTASPTATWISSPTPSVPACSCEPTVTASLTPTKTIRPTNTPTLTPTVTPTAAGYPIKREAGYEYIPRFNLRLRDCPILNDTTCPHHNRLQLGEQPVFVYCYWQNTPMDLWGSPDYDCMQRVGTEPTRWFVIQNGTTIFADLVEAPSGY